MSKQERSKCRKPRPPPRESKGINLWLICENTRQIGDVSWEEDQVLRLANDSGLKGVFDILESQS